MMRSFKVPSRCKSNKEKTTKNTCLLNPFSLYKNKINFLHNKLSCLTLLWKL